MIDTGQMARLELFYNISYFFPKLLIRKVVDLLELVARDIMSSKKLRVFLGCPFLLHVPSMLDHFMRKIL